MNNTIHIPEPCSEKWNSMKQVGDRQRHCEVCKTNVHDFTKSSLSEINSKLATADGDKICGRYHERHTSTDKKVYVLVNKMENKLIMLRLRRFSILLIAAILFLSGCAKRRTTTTMGARFIVSKDKKEQTLHAKL